MIGKSDIVLYLPGDYLAYRYKNILVFGVGMFDENNILYSYIEFDKKTNTYIPHLSSDFPEDRGKFLSLDRFFSPGIYNSIICDGNCTPKDISGECTGCCVPRIASSDPSKRIYFPGDTVYKFGTREELEVSTVLLQIQSSPKTGGISIFKPDLIGGRYRKDLSWEIEAALKDSGDFYSLWWNLRSMEPKLRYYLNGRLSGGNAESIRLRKRGKYFENIANFDTVCGMCVYQETKKCDNCKTKKLRLWMEKII